MSYVKSRNFLLIGVFSVFLSLTFFTIFVFAEYCKNIYCYEFDYICCCSNEENAPYLVVSQLQDYTPKNSKDPITCPPGVDIKQCELEIYNYKTSWVDWSDLYFIGSGNCVEESTWNVWCGTSSCSRWKCENEQNFTLNQGSTIRKILQPGQKIYTWNINSMQITEALVERYSLKRTGRAGGCEGIDIPGSVGCTFNPEGSPFRVYNEGTYFTNNFELAENNCYRITSEGDKRVCGSSCDKCETDSDCANLYTKQYLWNGRTLGGYCQNGQIVLYGCEGTGQQTCFNFDDLNKNGVWDTNEKCYEQTEKKDCSIVQRLTTGIECCTSDDCQGAGDYYCQWTDDTHSKCALNAQCQKDSDCGTATKCDRQTMQIKENYCNAEKQCAEKIIKEKIECCVTTDCKPNYYCTSDYKCELTPNALPTCSDNIQNQGEEGVDCGGPCSTKCANTELQQQESTITPPSITWEAIQFPATIIGIVVAIIAAGVIFYFTFMRKSGSKQKDEDDDLFGKDEKIKDEEEEF